MSSLGWGLALLALALLLLRQPIVAVALLVAGAGHMLWGRGQPEDIAEDLWLALDKEVLVAIPLYVLCGQLISRGQTARRLVDIMQALTRSLSGGMGVACSLACALDAAISGSSVVTMLAVGGVMLPSLLQSGYDRRYALGAVMSGGTLGIIIPPSIPLLVYGIVTDTSIVSLFKAGIGPGLLLTFCFVAYGLWVNRRMPAEPFDAKALVTALRRGIWAAMMPVVLLGGVYGGWLSLTESAALALAYAAVIELLVHRSMDWPALRLSVLETARIIGMLFPLLAVAVSLSRLATEHGLLDLLAGTISAWSGTDPLVFLLVVNVALLLLGCVMTADLAILLLAPLLAPLAVAHGVDKVLFGIMMVLNLEIGYLTPPVGMNLMVAAGAFRQPFGELCRASLPFIAIMLGCLALVMWQPWIALGR